MGAYISSADLRAGGAYEGVVLEEDLEQLSDQSLQNLLDVGKDLIDAYCGTTFEEPERVPNIVKLVNAQLVPFLLQDDTKTSESVDGYAYDSNLGSFSAILSKLDFLKLDGTTIAERKKSIRVRVI